MDPVKGNGREEANDNAFQLVMSRKLKSRVRKLLGTGHVVKHVAN